jgi:RNA polymerase sigma-70 factor (ECF subfamily)
VPSNEALDALLQKMRGGDLRAAEEVLLAHEAELRLIVRRRLSARLRAKFDSLDVVQSVWVHVLHEFRDAGCTIVSTDHLRNFLVKVTRNCLTDRLRHFRGALEHERRLADAGGAVQPATRQPRPSEVARANELWDSMLECCPPEYHALLRLKRQGLTLATIAERSGLHEDSVRRIFRKLARKLAFPSNELTA